ncbi:MAG: hypothetical protein ACK42Z_10120, partial [Candidatus Kapaibacteriota bacterium]
DKDIVGIELANKPYPPTLNEPCNLPHSRRVMIYVDVVNQELLDKKIFAREECGKLTYQMLALKEKPQASPPTKTFTEEELTINLDTLESDLPKANEKPKGFVCPGKCYRVVYGPARTIEEYIFLSNLLRSLGFEIDEDEAYKLKLVSKEKFNSEKDALELLQKLQEELKKLTPIIDIKRVKAYLEII